MVSGPKARILTHLAVFPASLESAWDAPRDICLPGIAQALGVVRSALHQPLADLVHEGYVSERKAHVFDGGSRKRKVYHISDEGRKLSSTLKPVKKKSIGELFGTPPQRIDLKGRSELIDSLLSSGSCILTGLPGIGKSAILAELAAKLVESGNTVRYARMEPFTDIGTLISQWGLEFSTERAALNATKSDILILDELQEISPRHLARIETFISKASTIIVACRAPIVIETPLEVIEVQPLSQEAAIQLLPPHLKNRESIADRLGCHPLALQLHDEGTQLPELGEDLQAWVKDVVLAGLGEEIVALDELALLPIPVMVVDLEHEEMVGILDDHALLRWHESGVELHHLVRNVRSTMLKQSDHKAAAEHWKNRDGDIARVIELHHILESGGDIEAHLLANAEALMVRSNAALATLVSSAIARYPSAKMHRLAAMVAIERGESDIAQAHLEHCDAADLSHSLALLQGRVEEFDLKDIKLILSEASRRLDDRLPNTKPADDIKGLLAKIDLSEVSPEMRKVMLVAIAHIKHGLAIANCDFDQAKLIRDNLISISNSADPQVRAMDLRDQIAQVIPGTNSYDELVVQVFSMGGLRATMLQLSLIEKADESNGKKLLERISLPDQQSQSNLSTARRIAAIIWYYRSMFATHNQFSSLAEAIALWKMAMCPNAAAQASQKMHSLI
ncbi:MAG: AAA family ATPase [Candidatus Poseidoniales archaeon]